MAYFASRQLDMRPLLFFLLTIPSSLFFVVRYFSAWLKNGEGALGKTIKVKARKRQGIKETRDFLSCLFTITSRHTNTTQNPPDRVVFSDLKQRNIWLICHTRARSHLRWHFHRNNNNSSSSKTSSQATPTSLGLVPTPLLSIPRPRYLRRT